MTRVLRRTMKFALLAVFLLVIIAPVVTVYAQALATAGDFGQVLSSRRQWVLFARTAGLAMAVTFFASLLGAVAAFLLQRLTEARRIAVAFLLTLPIAVPQYVMAIAWVDILGRNGYLSRFVHIALPGATPAPSPYNMIGAIFILSLTSFPIPMIATLAGLHKFDQRLVEAARAGGQSRGILLRVILPLVFPAMATGALIVFALTASSFAVPSLLQVTTYAVEIHASSSMFDYASAAAQSIPLFILVAAAFVAWTAYVRPRHAWRAGAQRGFAAEPQGGALSVLTLSSLVLFTCIVPVAALFVRSMPFRTYASIWATAHDEIVNGLLVATAAATVFTPITFALAYWTRGRAIRRLVNVAAVAAFIMPGSLLALGMIGVWNRAGAMGAVYDSLFILVLACGARYYAIGDTLFPGAFSGTSARVIEAASISGVVWWRNLLGIVLPLAFPAIIVVWVLLFVLSLGEVDAAVLLCPPGKSTFAVRLFSLMHYGPDSFVAALCVLTIAGVALIGACGALAALALHRRTRHHA